MVFMQKKGNFPLFLFLILISVALIALSKFGFLNGLEGLLQKSFSPFQKISYMIFRTSSNDKENSQNQNIDLFNKITDSKTLEKDNLALRDQFQTSYPKSKNLLPAKIVGAPAFIPGVSEPKILIIDKGAKDKVKEGFAVVYKNILVGKVTKTSSFLSKVSILTSGDFSFTAKTTSSGLGVIKGTDGAVTLQNVLLSEELKKQDIVLTNGDINENGVGFPPNLIVGKIISVEKKPSALFQSAMVEPILDFSKLTMVFVVLSNE